MPSPASVTYAPPLLWSAARALIATIFALFGDPSHIAWQHTHRKSERARLLKWLRAGEALMRHLLLIEASHIARANTRPLLHANKLLRRPRVRRLMAFEADKPEAWRVSFRCFSGIGSRCSVIGKPNRSPTPDNRTPILDRRDRWHQARWPKQTFHSAWPLAERAEAMLRAFNDPHAYARRLARHLHASPHRSAELARGQSMVEPLIAEPDFIALREATTTARRRFDCG